MNASDVRSTLKHQGDFDAICRSVIAKLGCDHCLISIVSRDLLLAIGHSQFGYAGLPLVRPLSDTICSKTMEAPDGLRVHDASQFKEFKAIPAVEKMELRSYLGVPLRIEGFGVIGAMCAVNRLPRIWSDCDAEYLRAVAEFVVCKIDAEIKRKELEALQAELHETDRIVALLARARSAAVTVHAEDGSLLFANEQVRDALPARADQALELPRDWIAAATRREPQGEFKVAMKLRDDVRQQVSAQYFREAGGLILCSWDFGSAATG